MPGAILGNLIFFPGDNVMDENSKIWILVPNLKYTGSGLRVKRCKEIAPCKQVFTVTELFNIIVNGFDAKKTC